MRKMLLLGFRIQQAIAYSKQATETPQKGVVYFEQVQLTLNFVVEFDGYDVRLFYFPQMLSLVKFSESFDVMVSSVDFLNYSNIYKKIAPQGVWNDRILLMIKRFIQNLVKHP